MKRTDPGRRRRPRHHLFVIALLLFASPRIVSAGDEDDRRRLNDEIDTLLREVAGNLDGLAGDSSSSDVDQAMDRASRVRDKLRDLERVQGDDSNAKERVSRYPGYVDRFRDSAQALKQLKDAQRGLDEQPRRCQDQLRDLGDKIRRYVEKNDPDGVTEIPRLAKEVGRPVVELLARSERQKDDLGRLRDRARNFSESDGRWADVRSELHEAANEIADYWMRRYDETRRECEELAKEDRGRLVEDALKKLTEGASGRQILIKELGDEIADTLKLVTDVEQDSGDGDVKSAERNVEDMRRLLDRLKSSQGEDKRAKEIAEKWPNEVNSMNNALLALDELKDLQFHTDRAPDRCKAEEEKITRAADAVERLDLEGDESTVARAADELDAVTKAAREGLLEALRKAADGRRGVDTLQTQTKNAWSSGTSELRSIDDEIDKSADDVAKHFATSHDKAKEVCAAPSLGPDHPAAKRAMKLKFGKCTKDEYVPLRRPVTEFCKQRLRQCVPGERKADLVSKAEVFRSCRDARVTLRDRCYADHRDTHDKEIETVERGMQKCIDLAKDAKD